MTRKGRPRNTNGSIFQRGDSARWWMRYQDKKGRTIRESTGTEDREEAERILRERLTARDQGTLSSLLSGKVLTFNEWADWFLENRSQPPIRAEATHQAHLQVLQDLRPVFGKLLLSDISPELIEEYLAGRLRSRRRIKTKLGTYEKDILKPSTVDRRLIDLDCGGWPQAARHRALAILRPVRDVIMLHGDQHIGSLVRHGIDAWEDGPIAFMVPGTSNGFPRAWWPDRPGENRQPGEPPWTGRYRDGLGNRLTVLGAANPEKNSNTRDGQAGLHVEEIAHRKGSGHGIVILHRKARTVTFEMWRHAFDAERPQTQDQFWGFPILLKLPA